MCACFGSCRGVCLPARGRVITPSLVLCALASVYFRRFRQIDALVKAGKTPILLHCRTAYRAIFGASTYAVLVAKTVSADKAIAGANLIGYAYPTTVDVNSSHWKNFGSVLTSTYTPAAGAIATTGASDATVPPPPPKSTTAPVPPPPPPKSTTAPVSRAVTDTTTNSVKVTSGVVRAAVSGVGLVLAAVVAAAFAL